jgi:hypothetical protein
LVALRLQEFRQQARLRAPTVRKFRVHLTVQPVLSYEEATHGGLMAYSPAEIPIIKKLKWHTKGSTKHFAC